MMKSIIVIGGGASGLMAAIAAAKEGACVTILEAMEKPGKKLLITGNGRCNLTNLDFTRKDCYRSQDVHFCRQVLEQFDYKKTIFFFEELGLFLQERNGGVYPLTDQAASVTDRLLLEAQKLHIKIKCREKAIKIQRQHHLWRVDTQTWHYEADALILAAGSMAAPATGSDGSGYELARSVGHTIQTPFPALVPLKCRESFVKKLAGLRTRAVVTMNITSKDKKQTETYLEAGELQWTEYGISGIVIFQLSRYASFALQQGRSVSVAIDCLPSVSEETLLSSLQKKAAEESVSNCLIGILPKKMIPVILDLAKAGHDTQSNEEAHLLSICRIIKHLPLTVTGTKSYEQAQVCGGGVSVKEINPHTMESRCCPDLYITGELMDVDGICGGYNLQWAWSTGYLAGRSSARKERSHD